MLTKVNNNNYFLGSGELYKQYIRKSFKEAHDNLNGYILIKNTNDIYVYNYNNNRYYKHNKIQVEFNGHKFVKHIDSFDQNNYLIANKLRMYVLSLIDKKNDIILGIGGEYYIYFPFINSNKYIGISNHMSIINDAKYNILWSKNYFVDYNNISNFPKITYADCIILNVFNVHINILNYIENIKFKKIILISCNLPDVKFKLLITKFKIISIKYFKNITGIIRVILIEKK